ncbi:MAG TPA: hypothetical protein VKE70_30355 [Candidatus Solibacter sp.]|nr:hypothetical protein [Candidatus Solibacter sp.]
MAVDNLAVGSREHRDLEAEFTDAAAHPIDGVVVFAGIASIEDQLVDWPLLDAHRYRGMNHANTSSKLIWSGGFFRRVRFALACRTGSLVSLYANQRCCFCTTSFITPPHSQEPYYEFTPPMRELCYDFMSPCRGGSGGEAQSKHTEGFDPPECLLCVKQLPFGLEPARRFAP